MQEPILVIGSSGIIGGAVSRRLQQAGYNTRCATRNPERSDLAGETVHFDWDLPNTFAGAVAGVKQVVMVLRNLDVCAVSAVVPFLKECRQAAVEHVLFISALDADRQRVGPMGLSESILRSSGLQWTILRPNFLMENFSHGWLSYAIQGNGSIDLPAGKGRTSFVSVVDVAEVVEQVMKRPELREVCHDLTGDDPMSHTAVAAALTRASGRPVNFHDLSEDQMREQGLRGGLPVGQLEYLLALYAMVKDGGVERKSSAIKDLLGRKPRSFDDFAQANANVWRVGP